MEKCAGSGECVVAPEDGRTVLSILGRSLWLCVLSWPTTEALGGLVEYLSSLSCSFSLEMCSVCSSMVRHSSLIGIDDSVFSTLSDRIRDELAREKS